MNLRPNQAIYLYAVVLFACTSNNGQQRNKPNLLKESFYTNGKIKSIESYNSKGLLDSVSTFYDESGKVSARYSFRNGKRHGLTIFVDSFQIIRELYENGSIQMKTAHDTLSNLRYCTPLNLNKVRKSKIKLSSGKSYFDSEIGDTLIIINVGLPYFNRAIGIKGALFTRLSDTSYILRRNPRYKGPSILTIQTLMYKGLGEFPEISSNGFPLDSIAIPMK